MAGGGVPGEVVGQLPFKAHEQDVPYMWDAEVGRWSPAPDYLDRVIPVLSAQVDRQHEGKAIMEAWRDPGQVGHLDAVHSNSWWSVPGLRDVDVRNVCRLRYDSFWCGEWRNKRYGQDGSCRACGYARDSWAHAILTCTHVAVSGAITNRHNDVVHAVARGVGRGTMARWLRLVNAGKDATGVEQATVPEWMCPGETQKPDMVIVEGWPYTSAPPTGPVREMSGRRVRLRLVEFTCTTESRVPERAAAKERKYVELLGRLQRVGWEVDPQITAIAFGVRGGITDDIVERLGRLGIPEGQVAEVVGEVHTAMMRGNSKVIKAKRIAERGYNGGRGGSTTGGHGPGTS